MKNSIVKDAFTVALNLKKCFIVKSDDYHAFGEAQFFFKQMGVMTKFKELEMEGVNYVAEFEIIGVCQS